MLATGGSRISIHALLAESDLPMAALCQVVSAISIHALLAESDSCSVISGSRYRHFYPRSPCGERRINNVSTIRITNFYPRSPCGERQQAQGFKIPAHSISIHALLAESDYTMITTICTVLKFLSTLSLRRATSGHETTPYIVPISIHALLAESDASNHRERQAQHISIHALLAESDSCSVISGSRYRHFYPRSPCGERLNGIRLIVHIGRFLSTLSLRRATGPLIFSVQPRKTISIHALLAESDVKFSVSCSVISDFYPRSPCGERLTLIWDVIAVITISIHALLAESDCQWRRSVKLFRQFLSTLSLRRATSIIDIINNIIDYFYPRSPCGERLLGAKRRPCMGRISIHALLAESDQQQHYKRVQRTDFYPRSPCGERRVFADGFRSGDTISIHALLAESDGRKTTQRSV